MHINYNRITREMWITGDDGDTIAMSRATRGRKMVDEAGRLISSRGLVRTGDYLLVSSGSPVRRATVERRQVNATEAGGATPNASAVARLLNQHFSPERFTVRQVEDQVSVSGPGIRSAAEVLKSRGGYTGMLTGPQTLRVITKVQ